MRSASPAPIAQAAKYAGMPFRRHLITVMLLSGAIAGIAGMLEVAGTVHRLQGGISNNFGYLGIMVAVLARGSALGVLAGAALMAVILNSGIILQTQGLNTSTVLAITGLILFFTAIGDELAHYRVVRDEPATDERPRMDIIAGTSADLDPRRRRTGAGGARRGAGRARRRRQSRCRRPDGAGRHHRRSPSLPRRPIPHSA